MILKRFLRYRGINAGLLIIRLWLGTIMIKHSTSYLFGGKMAELEGFLESLGWPMPEFMAWSSQVAELLAACLIILGMRLAAVLMAFTLSMAVMFAHGFAIYGEAELPFNYFVFALVLSLMGCGKPALDNRLFKT